MNYAGSEGEFRPGWYAQCTVNIARWSGDDPNALAGEMQGSGTFNLSKSAELDPLRLAMQPMRDSSHKRDEPERHDQGDQPTKFFC